MVFLIKLCRYRSAGFLTAIVAGLLSLPAFAQIGLGLAPMRAEFKAPRGARPSGTLRLSNATQVAVRVRAEVLDFFVDASGEAQFAANVPAESAYSCRRWVTLNPMEVDLKAGESVPVRYTINLPPDANESSFACAAGFTTILAPAPDAKGASVRHAVRMISVFYVTVGNPKVEGQLKDLALEYHAQGGKDSWSAVLVVDNQNATYVRPAGSLTLEDISGAIVETITIPLLPPTLPKRQQRYLVPLKSVTAGGHYRLRAQITLGSDGKQEGVAEVVALPGRTQ